MEDTLLREFEYYKKNKAEYLSKYLNKFVAIKEEELLGVYDNRNEAISETVKNHEFGTFLVHHVQDKEDVEHFYSRVMFTREKAS